MVDGEMMSFAFEDEMGGDVVKLVTSCPAGVNDLSEVLRRALLVLKSHFLFCSPKRQLAQQPVNSAPSVVVTRTQFLKTPVLAAQARHGTVAISPLV